MTAVFLWENCMNPSPKAQSVCYIQSRGAISQVLNKNKLWNLEGSFVCIQGTCVPNFSQIGWFFNLLSPGSRFSWSERVEEVSVLTFSIFGLESWNLAHIFFVGWSLFLEKKICEKEVNFVNLFSNFFVLGWKFLKLCTHILLMILSMNMKKNLVLLTSLPVKSTVKVCSRPLLLWSNGRLWGVSIPFLAGGWGREEEVEWKYIYIW